MNRLIKYTLTVVLTVAMSSCHIYRNTNFRQMRMHLSKITAKLLSNQLIPHRSNIWDGKKYSRILFCKAIYDRLLPATMILTMRVIM